MTAGREPGNQRGTGSRGRKIRLRPGRIIVAAARAGYRDFWSTALLATVPLAVSGELEAIAPQPRRAGEIAQFLIIRGLAAGVVEACVAVILIELCFRLIDAQAADLAGAGQGPEAGVAEAALSERARPRPGS